LVIIRVLILGGKEIIFVVLRSYSVIFPPSRKRKYKVSSTEFLNSVIMFQHDRVLNIADFTVHLCCLSSSSFTSVFIRFLDSLTLTRYIKDLSRYRGRTLTLVLSTAFCVEIRIRLILPSLITTEQCSSLLTLNSFTLICSHTLNSLFVSIKILMPKMLYLIFHTYEQCGLTVELLHKYFRL